MEASAFSVKVSLGLSDFASMGLNQCKVLIDEKLSKNRCKVYLNRCMIFQKKSFSEKKEKKFLTGNVRNDNWARVGAKKITRSKQI